MRAFESLLRSEYNSINDFRSRTEDVEWPQHSTAYKYEHTWARTRMQNAKKRPFKSHIWEQLCDKTMDARSPSYLLLLHQRCPDQWTMWIRCKSCSVDRVYLLPKKSVFFPTNQDRKKTTKMERHTHTKNIKMTIGGCVPVCVCAECNSSKVKSKSKSSADSTESNMKKKPHSFQTDHILLWV